MIIVYIVLGALAGAGAAAAGGWLLLQKKLEGQARDTQAAIKEADAKARQLLDDARRQADRIREEAKHAEREVTTKLRADEDRLHERERGVAGREKVLDEKIGKLDSKREELEAAREELRAKREAVRQLEEQRREELAKLAGIPADTAKQQLFDDLEREFAQDLTLHVERVVEAKKEEARVKATQYVVDAVQKYASEVANEATSTLVPIPSEDIKGKIIGKEGRNITVFETLTGVDVLVDDTPGAILIAGFDLMRRHIARVALERLISDGRINPGRIEEVVRKATEETNELVRKLGEESVMEMGITGIPPELYRVIGRLYFRTSYGQNILKHSKEVAHIAANLAGELGLDVELTKKAAFLHDLGKAVTHEIEGAHALIGGKILRKFNMHPLVVNAVEAHHGEVPYESMEAQIVAAADAISAARPGARSDNFEQYARRLAELENVATSYRGVEKAYAISAGREVRVFVTPKEITDLDAQRLAKDITREIEGTLNYPGEIKVTVIRELRVEEWAR